MFDFDVRLLFLDCNLVFDCSFGRTSIDSGLCNFVLIAILHIVQVRMYVYMSLFVDFYNFDLNLKSPSSSF